jgi:hypothetical protein
MTHRPFQDLPKPEGDVELAYLQSRRIPDADCIEILFPREHLWDVPQNKEKPQTWKIF